MLRSRSTPLTTIVVNEPLVNHRSVSRMIVEHRKASVGAMSQSSNEIAHQFMRQVIGDHHTANFHVRTGIDSKNLNGPGHLGITIGNDGGDIDAAQGSISKLIFRVER